MSLQAEDAARDGRDSGARAPEPASARHIEGLEGPVELRTAPGGFLQVWPRPTPGSLRTLYGEDFYEQDKTDYLTKMERDRTYWDATWSMRRKLMESALLPNRRRLLDIGSSGGFFLDHFQQHGWRCVGIEPSRSAADWAREKFGLEVFTGELLGCRPKPSTNRSTRYTAPRFSNTYSIPRRASRALRPCWSRVVWRTSKCRTSSTSSRKWPGSA